MLLVSNVQNTGIPVDVGEFQKQHFLAAQPRVHVKPDEFRPVVEVALTETKPEVLPFERSQCVFGVCLVANVGIVPADYELVKPILVRGSA